MREFAPLEGPRVPAASGGPPSRLIVLLHGYGADGNDLIGLAPYLARTLPDAAFVAPNGPEPCDMSPMGRQWFSLGAYDPDRMRADPAHRERMQGDMRRGAEGAAPALNSFLDAELQRYNLPDERLALVGFSQGTMMSLFVGLRRARPIAAIVGFSGSLLDGGKLPDEIRQRPPVMLVHGDGDDVVPASAMLEAAGGLAAAGVGAEWHLRPGLGHGIDPEGLAMAAEFLKMAFQGALVSQNAVS